MSKSKSKPIPPAAQARLLRSPVFWAGLLFLFTLAVYLPSLGCDFIGYDDPIYYVSNPYIQGGPTPSAIAWAFSSSYGGNWHPLTWISHMIDWSLWGMDAYGPHLGNVLLHVFNAELLFLLLWRLTGMLWRSLLVAALFALHPMHVESVTWVAERKDVLSTFFLLLTLVVYLRYVQQRAAAGAASGAARLAYLLALLCYMLGLLAKPMIVTCPFVMLLLDYWPLQRFTFGLNRARLKEFGALVYEKLPFFLLSAAVSWVTYQVQAVVPLDFLSLQARLANVCVAYTGYLGKLFWPTDLAILYPNPWMWPGGKVAVALTVLMSVSALVLWSGRRQRWLVFGWCLFLGTLVPVIGLVQVGMQYMADRYSYVSSIGIFIPVVWGGSLLLARAGQGRWKAGIVAVMVLVACSVGTISQQRHWENTGTLFRHALRVTENNYVAWNNLGYYYHRLGKATEAEACFLSALRISPDFAGAHYNLAVAYSDRRRYEDAIEHFRAALKSKPDYTDAHNELGVVLARTDRPAEAVVHFQEVLRVQPEDLDVRYNLGKAFEAQNDFKAAVREFSKVLRRNDRDAAARNHLGVALRGQGDLVGAERQFREAIRTKPDYADAHLNLASLLTQTGRRDEALAHARETIKVDPGNPAASNLLQQLNVPVLPLPSVR